MEAWYTWLREQLAASGARSRPAASRAARRSRRRHENINSVTA